MVVNFIRVMVETSEAAEVSGCLFRINLVEIEIHYVFLFKYLKYDYTQTGVVTPQWIIMPTKTF